MLTYDLSEPKNRPIYERLYHNIREDIKSGKIKAGERLPSKRALGEHLNISITTVENAYEQLQMEGYIYSKPSSGFFVAEQERKKIPAFLEEKQGVQGSAEAGQEKEETVYDMDFHGNLCSLKLFPITTWTKLMRQVLSDSNIRLLQTVPWNGLYSLRLAISDYLRRYRGMEVSPDYIVIGAGTEYLYSRLLQILGSKAIIAYENPGYRRLEKIAARAGNLQLGISIGEKGLIVEELKKSPANVVHLSPSNHFPTGMVMPEEERKKLINWANASMYRFIIEDDYDSEFSYQKERHQTLFSMDKNDRVIYMNTFSKSLVPSIRISYMILPKALYQLYEQSQDFYSCTVSSLEQMTLALFLSEGYFERHLSRIRNYYQKKRDRFYDALVNSDLKDKVQIQKNAAGTHLLVRVDTPLTDQEIHERAEERNVQIKLLSDYSQFPNMSYLHTLVVNYAGMGNDDIERAVELIEGLFSE
jgi:GntR family transcriptional regulator / MocR family aminotransferase